MNPWAEIHCLGCGQRVRFDQDTLIAAVHRQFLSILPRRMCTLSGQRVDPSLLPGWHPKHEHGVYCDGADKTGQQHMFTKCWDERMEGPPGAVDALGDLVDG